jgi:hypothetical protein
MSTRDQYRRLPGPRIEGSPAAANEIRVTSQGKERIFISLGLKMFEVWARGHESCVAALIFCSWHVFALHCGDTALYRVA